MAPLGDDPKGPATGRNVPPCAFASPFSLGCPDYVTLCGNNALSTGDEGYNCYSYSACVATAGAVARVRTGRRVVARCQRYRRGRLVGGGSTSQSSREPDRDDGCVCRSVHVAMLTVATSGVDVVRPIAIAR